MSNHNLFILGANGVAEPATSEQILGAARQKVGHRSEHAACDDRHPYTLCARQTS